LGNNSKEEKEEITKLKAKLNEFLQTNQVLSKKRKEYQEMYEIEKNRVFLQDNQIKEQIREINKFQLETKQKNR